MRPPLSGHQLLSSIKRTSVAWVPKFSSPIFTVNSTNLYSAVPCIKQTLARPGLTVFKVVSLKESRLWIT